MELFSDVVMLSRLQFAICVIFHFLFVPLSIGLGLFVALAETRYYKTGDPKDRAATKFWAKIFTTTFIIGVATGITMEFSFGTNWANYARYVGDIFGAPLAAEALLAFFLESIFLGIVLFARAKISPKLYLISTWLVFIGSALSALWILIANSWMQTPAGYQDLGTKAEITDFWGAALNPSTVARYLHTVDSVIILASFCVIAIGAYYLLRKTHVVDGKKFIKTGLTVGIISVILMLPFAHMQASVVAEQQPAKLAAMEGQWEDGPVPFTFFGWVDEDSKTTVGPALNGFTSLLASFDTKTVYPGLNTTATATDFNAYPGVKAPSYQGGNPPVNLTFQAYHIMVGFYALLIIWLIIAGIMLKGVNKGKTPGKAALYLLVFGPLIPFACIQAGWMVAEVGRQPWVVYDLLLTADAISPVVSAPELLITITLFVVFYLILFIAWLRLVLGQIKKGPQLEQDGQAEQGGEPTPAPAAPKVVSAAKPAVVSKAASASKGGE
jgi:cytochrome d ubiquinol oxidase subunit I